MTSMEERAMERTFQGSTFKERLTLAFATMRSRYGLVARQNFLCCGNCAGTKIASDVSAMPGLKRSRVKGCVFYTRQDAAKMEPSPKRTWLGAGKGWATEHVPAGTYLSFGEIDTQAHGTVGLPTEAVGRFVRLACEAAGLEVEWDGQAATRIWVQERREWTTWQLGVAVADAAALACGGVA
jgi:Domain of unknown function (DUF6891)